jgi:hypothetical protein
LHKKAEKFEKYKDEYLRVLQLSDSEIQSRREIEQDIFKLVQQMEYFKDQFGHFKDKKKTTKGVLDKKFKEISCEGGMGHLCEWRDKYKQFAEYLVEIKDIFRVICASIII